MSIELHPLDAVHRVPEEAPGAAAGGGGGQGRPRRRGQEAGGEDG